MKTIQEGASMYELRAYDFKVMFTDPKTGTETCLATCPYCGGKVGMNHKSKKICNIYCTNDRAKFYATTFLGDGVYYARSPKAIK